MRRREFISILGSTIAWPFATHAQQLDRMRRIGVLMAFDENDPEPKSWLSGLTKALAELGWTDG
jgi:putative tryptophan/tyrosine transport system substrate-binding protein